MSNTKHSFGPWYVDADIGLIKAAGGEAIVFVYERPERSANECLIAAAPDLLAELRAARQIIVNALQVMDVQQKTEWGNLNLRDGVEGDGITRFHERDAVIAKAEGRAS